MIDRYLNPWGFGLNSRLRKGIPTEFGVLVPWFQLFRIHGFRLEILQDSRQGFKVQGLSFRGFGCTDLGQRCRELGVKESKPRRGT